MYVYIPGPKIFVLYGTPKRWTSPDPKCPLLVPGWSCSFNRFYRFRLIYSNEGLTLGLFLLHGRLGYCNGILLRSHWYICIIFGSFQFHASFYRPAILTDVFVVFLNISWQAPGEKCNLGHDRLLSRTLQSHMYYLAYPSRLFSLKYR